MGVWSGVRASVQGGNGGMCGFTYVCMIFAFARGARLGEKLELNGRAILSIFAVLCNVVRWWGNWWVVHCAIGQKSRSKTVIWYLVFLQTF